MSDSSLFKFAITAIALVTTCVGCGDTKIENKPLNNARQLLFEKDFAAALAQCDEILERSPSDYETLLVRGEVNLKSGQEEAALNDFSAAINAFPKRPDAYDWRYKLYVSLATKAAENGDEEASDEFELLAVDDYNKFKLYDPTSVDSFKVPGFKQPKSLEKPIPGMEPELDAASPLDIADTELPDDDPLNGLQQDAPTDVDSLVKATDPTQPTDPIRKPIFQKDRKAATSKEEVEREIAQRDLDSGEPEDLTLPPHDDVADDKPLDQPKKQVTRFDLPIFVPPPQFGQNRRTTGITHDGGTAATNGPAGPPRGLPFGVPMARPTGIVSHQADQDGAPQAGVGQGIMGRPIPTSGINSRRSMTGSPFLQPSRPLGFLQQSPQASGRGPAPPRQQPSDEAAPEGGKTPPLLRGPVITMALPGTEITYGSKMGKNALGSNPMSMSLTDPEYTPFVRRPKTVQYLPTLPSE